jgi:hypothetical protein
MSFPRHERSIVRWGPVCAERMKFRTDPHRFDESQPAIPWRVALKQSSPPLHQLTSSSFRRLEL